ncbi:uncharacterized protein LOC103702653 [Phoenix dactylifera]|uniref:Uncharacterized protein LOC103702653 n=1 Tax=Phoenix dactylifera TaxID=42345 RepID=A0A8B7BQT7_PHODC|nr:uncharacterized protein LOC103702653 [Phoenix dactylifera]
MEGSGELQCVGKMEIAKPKPVGFLCGTLPVPTDSTFPLFQSSSALVPSPHTIGAPRYQMLPAETDLNTLPLLSNIPEKVFPSGAKSSGEFHCESSPITQNLSQKCEALAVSGLTEYGDEIDVVAPTDILKQIFKIPYSKAQLSIAVHRIGDTLILNTGPDVEEGEKMYRRQNNQSKGSDPSIFLNFAMHSVRAEACDCPPSHQPSSEKQSSSTILPGHFGHMEGTFVSATNSHAKSQFFDQNASGRRKSSQGNHDKFFWGTKQNKQKGRRPDPIKKTSEVGEKPRCPMQESDKFRREGNNGFLRVLFWQFHNFRMLLGSDLLLFSNEKYVAVSLHLWDVSRQVTPLTWLEAWLDNVMASVPELAICYHENGVVQGYELLKTDDIFLLKGISEDGTAAFHPQVVQQNGLSVLRFLQDNCKQDPGAYWLYKGAGEDVIQLFDLSVIPKNHSTDDQEKSCSSFPSLMNKGRRDSLFSLGVLLYRIAHRLSLSKAPDSRVKCAKFFKKCLDFLSEQDHLVVRAYAHEQFARLILKCYEELELPSESFLLESEVTVTDLEDESSEFSLEMFGSGIQEKEKGSSHAAEDATSIKAGTSLDSLESEESGTSKLETEACLSQNISLSATNGAEDLTKNMASSRTNDELDMCQIATSPHLVCTVSDPISSKLAAIHHVSQAIKSLRWKRQLQNAQEGLIDHGNKIHERFSSVNFSLCTCGDSDCVEVCDIREWLPKSKMDNKMWKLVLLLGESYLALGEAYKEDGQLHRALKVVELACLVYGSMPQHLEDAYFISSMTSISLCQVNFRDDKEKTNLVMDGAKDLDSEFLEDGYAADQFSPIYLFWSNAWTLVADVFVEYHRTRGKEIPVQAERKTSGNGLRMSDEIVKEVKRLKKKLGRYKQNCSSCSLINCSCQSDRANSGNSASSSSGDSPSSYGRKQIRKSMIRNSSTSPFARIQDDNNSYQIESANFSEGEQLQNNNDSDMLVNPENTCKLKESYKSADVPVSDHVREVHTTGSGAVGSEPSSKDASEVRNGGIFKFLEGPKYGDVEYNLTAAIGCYDAARNAMDGFPIGLGELHSVLKKKGWVCNELGRYRLENRNLISAESAFSDALKAFKEVSDHTNVILINCNLGHGRRALAEELVSKIDEFKKYDLLQNAYKQAMKSAKSEYFDSLKYYGAAKAELTSLGNEADSMLCNEVCTQYAHTYLRLGMLLARESISAEGYNDEFPNDGRTKEHRKYELSASDAFREALSTYESLGESRKQEAAFAHFQLACYHRDLCLKFLDLDLKHVKHSKYDNRYRQKAKWYASLTEKNWQKSIDFYGPKTHPVMYMNILLEQSALSFSLSNSFHSNMMLEAALLHLLEGRHVVEANEDFSHDKDLEIKAKLLNQLQELLKSMLTTSLSGSKPGTIGQAVPCNRVTDSGKLKEMYRMSLKSNSLSQLHALHKLWFS